MKLPVNVTPTYTLVLPSSGATIKYGPFLVKDEKALLLAHQSSDNSIMADTLKEVIKNCIKSNIDVDSLASFDIQYIFTQLRAVSVGEIVDIVVKCPNCNTEEAKTPVQIDLTKVECKKPEGHTDKISLFGDVGIKMKYPNLETVKKLETLNTKDPDVSIDIICDCIDYIYNSEAIFKPEDISKEDLIEYINNLTKKQMDGIRTFFRTMPKIYIEIPFTCPVCQESFTKRLEGLGSFFSFV